MKAANIALAALAGFGLATSQVAFADTLPGAALPTVSHAHPARLVRLTEKRPVQGADSNLAGGIPVAGLIFGAVALGALVYGIVEVSKSSSPGA